MTEKEKKAEAENKGLTYYDTTFREMYARQSGAEDRCWEEHLKEYPPGSLNLPPLLEKRRLEYKLAAGFFLHECLWDYVMVAQISYDSETDKRLAGAGLERPEAYADADKRRSYMGILTSAGSTALDALMSEGVTLGHIVRFMRYTPFQFEVEVLKSEQGDTWAQSGVDLVVTDIRSSMDLAINLRHPDTGCRREVRDYDDGRRENIYVDGDGKVWRPEKPTIAENWT
jgi:hypothetical protein